MNYELEFTVKILNTSDLFDDVNNRTSGKKDGQIKCYCNMLIFNVSRNIIDNQYED